MTASRALPAAAAVVVVVVAAVVLWSRSNGPAQPNALAPSPSSSASAAASATAATGAPSSSPSGSSTARPSASPSSSAGSGQTPASSISGSDWPTYHKDLTRRGASSDVGSFAAVDPAWQSDPLDGDVYAEPIVVGSTVIVATERNVVYGIDARNGQQQWRAQLGTPVDASTLPCGDIRPVSGITGTPAADASSATVYVVAFEQPAHHELYAIGLHSGAVRFHRTVDAPNADPKTHQERGALALANGSVYVPYGGLFGDCGSYHGLVVGVPAGSAGGSLLSYQVPTPREAGIWATPGTAADGNGRLFVATGNGGSQSAFDYSNAVLRLSADLHLDDYWAAGDWLSLSRSDTDIGSVGPTLVDGGFLIEGGKNGYVYVLNADALGGIGGEVNKLKVGGGIYGGFAYASGVAYVPCMDGTRAVQVGGDGSLRVLWRGPGSGSPIVAGGAVWTTAPGSGTIYALDLGSGAVRVQQTLGTMQHFTTPTAYGDLIMVAAGGRLVALRMH